jgi:predicted  nucleic acid-binding Zn-ribbon protein
MTEHLCDKCGNLLKLVTPIVACCPHCDSVRPVNVRPPAPIPARQVPPQPPPAYQETDELGSETECAACGGLEKKVTPLMAVCGVCGAMRSLLVKPVRDAAREQTVLRELIVVEQQLRTRGLPPTVRADLVKRLRSLRAEKRQFDGR